MTTEATVALVTGANKGIGMHIADQLARAGARVYVGARDAGRGRGTVEALVAEGLDAHLAVIDVTDVSTIAAAAELVGREAGLLDVLVNNAGISTGFEAPSQVSLDQLRETFETNLFGVVATTNAFLPLLRASRAGRIVNVSSGLGSIGLMAAQIDSGAGMNAVAYQASKAALNAVTVAYAKELRPAGILVNAVSPGLRRTDLGGGNVDIPGAGDPAGGAEIAVAMALLGDDGPTGTYQAHTGDTLPW